MGGNVGRTGTQKTNQDSVFISKIDSDGQLMSRDQIKKHVGASAALSTGDWFCAVADGHGQNGHFVSQFIQMNMPKTYTEERKKIERVQGSAS